MNLSNSLSIELIEETKKSYKILIEGRKDKMAKSNFESDVRDFMKVTIDFIKEQKEFNQEQKEFNKRIENRLENVDNRLDVLESFHKEDFVKLKK